MIGRELKDGNDELSEWAKARPAHFISNDDANIQQIFTEVVQAVMTGDYNASNRDNFLAKADPWIIVKAKSIGVVVVTHESFAALNTKKVKVPNIFQQFGVPCMNTFQFCVS